VSTTPNTFARALDQIGSAICSGTIEAGSALTVQQLIELTGASRSIVREATQVLTAVGMVEPRQRVGMRILPQERWNPLDPRIVGWQLRGATRSSKVEELFDLRLAVEPAAAELAAVRRTDDDAAHILTAAEGLADAADARDEAAFTAHDADFHRRMLAASGNASFVYLSAVIEAALADRDRGLAGEFDHAAIGLHFEVARHIQLGNADGARRSMVRIVSRTRASI
jgi:DNA-binding FadR family transcriptional regulator